jgi:hypothetical protein
MLYLDKNRKTPDYRLNTRPQATRRNLGAFDQIIMHANDNTFPKMSRTLAVLLQNLDCDIDKLRICFAHEYMCVFDRYSNPTVT